MGILAKLKLWKLKSSTRLSGSWWTTCKTEVRSFVYVIFNKFIYCKIKLIFRTNTSCRLHSSVIDNSLSQHAALQFRCLRPAIPPSCSSAGVLLFYSRFSVFLLWLYCVAGPLFIPECTPGFCLAFNQEVPGTWQSCPVIIQSDELFARERDIWWMSVVIDIWVPPHHSGSKLNANWEYVSRFILNLRVHIPSTSWSLMWLLCYPCLTLPHHVKTITAITRVVI